MTPRPPARTRGFSLLELVFALGLVAILAGVAVPGFARMRADVGAAVAADQLVAGLQFARASALARAAPTSLCPSADGSTCTDSTAGPVTGWLVFVGSQATDVNGDGSVLRAVRLSGGYRLTTSRGLIAYWPDARAGTTGTFVVCRGRAPATARTVVVSQTGRPRVGAASAAQGEACAA